MFNRFVVVILFFFVVVDRAEMKGSSRLLCVPFAHLNEERERKREKEPFV